MGFFTSFLKTLTQDVPLLKVCVRIHVFLDQKSAATNSSNESAGTQILNETKYLSRLNLNLGIVISFK